MADTNPTDCDERDTARPAAQDAKAERTVLAFLLSEYPNQLTIAEVAWALNASPAKFESDDAAERAVRELVGAGLLRCEGGYVVPTRAAVYFARLEID
jgi:hypothetical protein